MVRDLLAQVLVDGLTDLSPDQRGGLAAADLNAVVTVAALGFGDIPPAAFGTAFNVISTPGLLAFTIKDDLVSAANPSGFHLLIQRRFAHHVIASLAQRRFSTHGDPLHFVTFVVHKPCDIPAVWIA